MATKRSSQTQQMTSNDPFAQIPGVELWWSMMEAQRERLEQLATELSRMEKERHERALAAIDEAAALVKSGVEYNQQLTAQWRDLALETARRSANPIGGNN